MSSLAQRWLRNVPALRETQLRAGLVSAEVDEHTITEVAIALEEVCQLAEQAHERAREVLGAAIPVLTQPARAALVERLREEAHEAGHLALARFLRKRGGLRDGHHEVPEPDARHVADPKGGKTLTLGERKALARARDRDVLDRLLRDPHPHVIRNILSNPRITEDDVVRLAAKRPTFPDIQAEIAGNLKWGFRQRVRLALVQNPYTPPAIAVPILSMLVRPELFQVVAATDIPPIVRGAALELLDRRPPIPVQAEPETKQ